MKEKLNNLAKDNDDINTIKNEISSSEKLKT